ncbi:MAG: SRPBCC family protein [Proteobacteria bacterium]|nr:SRPBCC family protein [Pseudomonadota bacterium]
MTAPATAPAYPLSEAAHASLAVDPQRAFDWLDDHRHLSSHMDSSSWMMAGSSMSTEIDERRFQEIGSRLRMKGRVLGVPLELDEQVVVREPPRRKFWETIGEPRLLVIGPYRMGFEIETAGSGTALTLRIDYRLSSRRLARGLGLMLGRAYARWCVRTMVRDAQRALQG